jgi:hypothetical protein
MYIIALFPSKEQKDRNGNVAPPSNTELYHVIKRIGRAWAILGGLGGPVANLAGAYPVTWLSLLESCALEM